MLQSQSNITKQACLKEHNNMQYSPTRPPFRFYFVGCHKVTIILSTTNKMQRYTIFFITVNALHVSGGFSAHHLELKTVNTISGTFQAWLLLPLSVAASKLDIYQELCTVLSS
jgi:hypothetical protein